MRAIILGFMILSFVECGLVYAQAEQLNKTAYVDTHVHLNALMRGGQQQDSESYPNLYLSVRGEERLYDRNGKLRLNRIVDVDGKIRPEWLKLIGDFPDRFMAGTDDFFGASIGAGGGKYLPTTSKETWGIVNQLPSELAGKVGGRNAARIYNLN